MVNELYQLPNDEQLNIAFLSNLFQKTTNSYKYLFFLAILDILEARHFNYSEPIDFREIAVEMLANAWYPHIYFKLSFGVQDQISNKLDTLNLDFEQFQNSQKRNLKEAINQHSLDGIVNEKGILRFVPFRLIRPFFENELRKIKDYDVNPNITILANEYFETRKSLYKFNNNNYQDCTAIILHPQWVEYLRTNYTIIRGWASWEWLSYMQRRNPNIPAIANKLFQPQKRESSLKEQRKYWKIVLDNSEVKCIYSNVILSSQNLSLDHYLPWSFVTHDQLWNLIPTNQSVNSSKSNNIPSDIYFDKFVELQHLGLIISSQNLSHRQWYKYIESYLLDLKISNVNNLLELTSLHNAYQATIKPLISIAENQKYGIRTFFNHCSPCSTSKVEWCE